MSLKGKVLPDHAPINQFELIVVGLPKIFFITCSGIEETLQTVDLPDRTKASGGQTNPVDFEASQMLHHTVERAALELWFKEGQDPVSPTYKKPGTLIYKSLSGRPIARYTLLGVFISARTLPETDRANEGEPAVIMWSMHADDILPL
jgi:hypothetical protein